MLRYSFCLAGFPNSAHRVWPFQIFDPQPWTNPDILPYDFKPLQPSRMRECWGLAMPFKLCAKLKRNLYKTRVEVKKCQPRPVYGFGRGLEWLMVHQVESKNVEHRHFDHHGWDPSVNLASWVRSIGEPSIHRSWVPAAAVPSWTYETSDVDSSSSRFVALHTWAWHRWQLGSIKSWTEKDHLTIYHNPSYKNYTPIDLQHVV